ncbi:cob(I)yrinic acid a,c-diamide adenosyltransferase [Tessaracoccus sp. MC1865]|uniref:cob(I)yrinic acid a,c-diamide adenosyltransferase n=1 Tax=unclassified Tessaracoccus TaxID=2635419 RepID=UPI001601AE21|nr:MULTISPECIES: cob(I)yrinic acid a,c-diamide adenosyltransferase [unclassified Tessaracoccus]MBB1483448.1 cob(I)yrinic acid a,c-diamide adenosyltransferase [Tessaracoccus sp. MC1865]MBB1509057.1 cob(I)yrinic acid a,c-diamide adenosyltransferase [Tessaracoccus sp. MC1756]QTO36548.1 cob(I)yrinic acid a,c-diamide adenosyltransferase [Tessaracoccus sp. MC1865]
MVTLSKIYTRTGDAGTTRLSDNSEVRKTDLRVEAYGHTDEANSVIGVAVALGGLPDRVVEMLALVRNELFDVGADISNPLDPDPKWPPLRIEQPSIDRLEAYCDELQEDLPVLRSFILPGGSPSGAQLHVARTVARRAERAAWACAEEHGLDVDGGVNSLAIKYLNRLSDLLFIMSRAANGTEHEVLWVPGTDREKPARA